MSVGTGTLGHDGDDLDRLYRHADSMLYEDKARHAATRRLKQREADRQTEVQAAADAGVARAGPVTRRPLRLL